MKIQIQLVDYYKAFQKQEKQEKDKEDVKQYIKDIDEIFKPENLELYNRLQPYTSKSRDSKSTVSEMSETKMARRKTRNLHMAQCDLYNLEHDIPPQRARVVELSEEHGRLKKDLHDLINQSLHCLIKARPYFKTGCWWFGPQMCKWRKQAHQKAVDEFTKKQPESKMFTPVFVNPVLQKWYDDNVDWGIRDVPVDFAGKMCLVTEFSLSRRVLGGD